MPPLVKICGLSTPETVDAAIRHGATHIGFVHYEPSPRHVGLQTAADLRRRADGRVRTVVLLVNPAPAIIGAVWDQVRPDAIQFHGDEAPDLLAAVKAQTGAEAWKAVGIRDAAALDRARRYAAVADRLLYDAPAQALPGGTGTRFDWSLLAGHRHAGDWGVAGGLNPANVAQAIAETGAPLVDVSSGVESAPGVKDVDKIAAFLKAAGR
ncbi:MAG: phosphoribosylanthranilate isomerase [Sphingopyxis macrogoltabida]|uniref:N-(5'-phosphoribosyl)anthranilate isomerase n=1 Tax=Sphingopyxis macrogoltabida TaxID=33050 RepID=A0A2W5L281_SPHMC|nr:MAG: phosphoribosylanthranilate isomerase [Sphingopyxis macrogoltabida]